MVRSRKRRISEPLLLVMFVVAAMLSGSLQVIQIIYFLPSFTSMVHFSASDFPIFDVKDVLPTNQTFGVCLLSMEDNHILSEWIAYHYTVLPLRRLIIAVDPRSRTSPKSILHRWKDLIEITEWKDKDYFNLMYRSAIQSQMFNSTADMLTAMHRFRQRFFYFKCLRQMKREKQSYVALIDSDEFLNGPNPNWKYNSLLEQQMLRRLPESSERWERTRLTITDLLYLLRRHKPTSAPCVSLPRLQFGTKDTCQNSHYNPMLLDSLLVNASDLLTLSWTWHGQLHATSINKAGKALVDVSRIPSTSFDLEHSDPHRPVHDYCSENGVWIENVDSPLVVHHYVGTFEQWAFRLDPRGVRTKDRYDSYKTLNSTQDTSVSNWLEYFVADVGIDRARQLLSGVGRIERLSLSSPSVLSADIYNYLKYPNVTANVTRLT